MENWSFMFKREFPVMIAGMYQRKSLDSLKKIFPGFEKSKKEIEQAVNMEQKYENMIRTEKQDEQFVFIVRTIYFTKGEKKKIIGEIETTIDSKDFMAPVVTAYRFTEGKHLKNYKELLKEIEEEMQKPPPPPMEVLIKQ
jgi:hypothetical protein